MASEPQAETSPLSKVDRSAARYLLAISALSGADADRVTTGALQDRLDVSPPSVTGMVSRLDDRGLVDHEKFRGVTLTERGEALAARVGWRFCVVSTFFDSVLDASLDDETAFAIGFALPETGVVRLRELAGPACLGLCPASDGDAERCPA